MTNFKQAHLKSMQHTNKLCQPVPGHPELTSNKMAQIWNNLKLHNAKSIAGVRALLLNGVGKIYKID